MANYTHEYSNFPNSPISLTNYKDVTDQEAEIINEYKRLLQSGQYDGAAAYAQKYKSQISKCLIGAANYVALQEEVRNTQILALKKSQTVFTSTSEPPAMDINDVWIGGN